MKSSRQEHIQFQFLIKHPAIEMFKKGMTRFVTDV